MVSSWGWAVALTPGGARKAQDGFAMAGGHGLKNCPELPHNMHSSRVDAGRRSPECLQKSKWPHHWVCIPRVTCFPHKSGWGLGNPFFGMATLAFL